MLLNDANGFLCKQVCTVLSPLSPDGLGNYNKENKRIEKQSKLHHSRCNLSKDPLFCLGFVKK